VRNARIVVTRLAAVTSLACVQSSLALAGDVVTLRCDFPAKGNAPAYYKEIIADQNGISETSRDMKTNEITFKAYTSNAKSSIRPNSYYRINVAEIAWGWKLDALPSSEQFDSNIDLRRGEVSQSATSIGKDGITNLTDTGNCKPD